MAVLGTLLGSLTTHFFQRRATRSEALRQERTTTYSAFAAAVEEYRRGQAERWYRLQEDPEGDAFLAARDEAHRLRTAARQALYRVKLLTDEPAVVAAAEHAYASTRDVSTAHDQDDRDARHADAGLAIEAFVARAARLLR
ncbi:hypothetical protein GCM10010218_34870 [Streptomyces mashuensis]|uniref:Protein kilB n=1 Tax=Streptomyces mashuensis TaxID=33904 RepID=A0A919EDN9_9ACTN|nr:hypothetical protein GCM10010218_34870 [Streptomyces mashuensis]